MSRPYARSPRLLHSTTATVLVALLAVVATVVVRTQLRPSRAWLDWDFLIAWVLAANVVAFGYFAWDKSRAKAPNAARVPEIALLWTVFLLGELGAVLGMLMFRHKTRKRGFQLGMGVIVALHLSAVVLWLRR